jgi:hypothetical protein
VLPATLRRGARTFLVPVSGFPGVARDHPAAFTDSPILPGRTLRA